MNNLSTLKNNIFEKAVKTLDFINALNSSFYIKVSGVALIILGIVTGFVLYLKKSSSKMTQISRNTIPPSLLPSSQSITTNFVPVTQAVKSVSLYDVDSLIKKMDQSLKTSGKYIGSLGQQISKEQENLIAVKVKEAFKGSKIYFDHGQFSHEITRIQVVLPFLDPLLKKNDLSETAEYLANLLDP